MNTNKAPMKSALRKKTKETVKEFKNKLTVTVRLSVTFERKKKQIRKKVYAKLIDTLRLIREDLLEGESDVAFLPGKRRKEINQTPNKNHGRLSQDSHAFQK